MASETCAACNGTGLVFGDEDCGQCTRPAPEYAGLVERDDYDIAAAATNHADKVLRAAGSALKHYTTPSIKKAILSAMLDAIEEAYRAGADLVIARTSDLTARNKALEAEIERLREALLDCAAPMRILRRHAEEQGRELNGMAYTVANDVHFVKEHARKALEARP